jgi:hypothetical protein
MPSIPELLESQSFDEAAVIRHGFVDYIRDYEIIVTARLGGPLTDIHRYLFIGCVEARYQTAVADAVFVKSLPDSFVYAGPDYVGKPDPDGFIWGVRASRAYPGLSYETPSPLSQEWSNRLGLPMHHVNLTTEAFSLDLVFADVRYACSGNDARFGNDAQRDFPISPIES